MKFETLPHIVETVNGYVLKVFESDPYYHVEVSKDGKHYDDHLLVNDVADYETLKIRYKNKTDNEVLCGQCDTEMEPFTSYICPHCTPHLVQRKTK